MSTKLEKQIEDMLKSVILPDGKSNVIDSGMVSSVSAKGNSLSIILEADSSLDNNVNENIRRSCEEALMKLLDIEKVTVVMTAKKQAPKSSQGCGSSNSGNIPPQPKQLQGIKNIIAIASGKGGVGKSTVSVNLAVSLVKQGFSVGLVDADIYGPSIARMMNITKEPLFDDTLQKIIPPESNGVKCMSIGFFLDENTPAVWRAPMLLKALKQLIEDARWGELDFLLIDMPPGTGDIHLNIVQNFYLNGAVIVSTPQDVALMDVRKSISMFKKTRTPILGIVENMSYFIDPASGNKTHIFGKGGVEKMAREFKLRILGSIPISPLLTETSDKGTPFVATYPDDEISKEYNSVAAATVESQI